MTAGVVEDLSAWVLSGRVVAEATDSRTDRTVRQGLDDVVDAERLGFRRVFLPERYNLKEAGAFLGGAGALTSRIGLGTGVLGVRSRHPLLTAALGATMHAAYGPRFVVGLGRLLDLLMGERGHAGYQEMVDHAGILKRLWRGETVTYVGPAGTYEGLALGDLYPGPPPEVWIAIVGGPLGTRAAANPAFDGVMLYNMMTPDACRTAIARIRRECEAIGRDPATLRICQPVVTAPDLDDFETRALAHARLVTYVLSPGAPHPVIAMNGWDAKIVDKVRNHAMFERMEGDNPDEAFHREQLMGPAALIPDAWIEESCAVGSARDCAKFLRAFKDAGADEIATYGSTPGQNAGVLECWREGS